jgi:hypothetical protein
MPIGGAFNLSNPRPQAYQKGNYKALLQNPSSPVKPQNYHDFLIYFGVSSELEGGFERN